MHLLAKTFAAGLIVLFSTLATAGELILTNGDRVEGELISSNGETLEWASTNFGKIKVSVSKVQGISSNQIFKIAGYDGACNFTNSTSVTCFEDHSDPIEWVLSSKIIKWGDYKDEYENDGWVRVAGKSERGAKTSDTLTIEAQTAWTKSDIKHRLFAYYDGDRPSDTEERYEQYKLKYFIDWYFRDRTYLNANLAFESDEKTGVDARYDAGVGIGYRLLQLDHHKLFVEAGPSLLSEEYSSAFGGESNERIAFRWYTNWSYKFKNDLKLFHNHTYRYSNDLVSRYEWNARSGLHFPMGSGMYTEFRHELDYDSEPVDPALREDSKFTLGVGYNW